MNKTRVIAYPLLAAIGAAAIVWLVGLLAFGAQVSAWSEWQGRLVGVAGTIAAVLAAAVIFWRIFREERGAID